MTTAIEERLFRNKMEGLAQDLMYQNDCAASVDFHEYEKNNSILIVFKKWYNAGVIDPHGEIWFHVKNDLWYDSDREKLVRYLCNSAKEVFSRNNKPFREDFVINGTRSK